MLNNTDRLDLEKVFDDIFSNLLSEGYTPYEVLDELIYQSDRAYNQWLDSVCDDC